VGAVLRAVVRQGAELAPAVGSPRAAMKGEQERTSGEEFVERVDHAARIRQREERRRLEIAASHNQKQNTKCTKQYTKYTKLIFQIDTLKNISV
jgi:hypothetical protein